LKVGGLSQNDMRTYADLSKFHY